MSPSCSESPVKIILVTGSVVSGIGKGVISSSLGVLLKANGYRVTAIKIDPYLNVDAGTFSPYEHGEVFVLDDGGEVDLDLGNYERFLNVRLNRDNNITTGKIYQQVIANERMGEYLGKTVQTVPHITDAIFNWIEKVAQIPVDGSGLPPDVCIVELGGTVGDVEGMAFIQSFSERWWDYRESNRLMVVHVTMLLYVRASGEVKTKPAQFGIKKLRETGLLPDLLICRCERKLSEQMRAKVQTFALLEKSKIIDVHDVSNIYKVPLILQEQNVLHTIQKHFKLPKIHAETTLQTSPNMVQWAHLSEYMDLITSHGSDSGSENEEVKVPRRLKPHTTEFKLKVVKHAKQVSNHDASKKFGLSRSTVQEDSSPAGKFKKRLKGGGRPLTFKDLDQQLFAGQSVRGLVNFGTVASRASFAKAIEANFCNVDNFTECLHQFVAASLDRTIESGNREDINFSFTTSANMVGDEDFNWL